MKPLKVAQVNLNDSLGGGEVFVQTISLALERLGYQSLLLNKAQTTFWQNLSLASTLCKSVKQVGECVDLLAEWQANIVIFHFPVQAHLIKKIQLLGIKTITILHMPRFGRDSSVLAVVDRVVCVSNYVRQSLMPYSHVNVWAKSLYGVAQTQGSLALPLTINSRYSWDQRKIRDVIYGYVESKFFPSTRKIADSRKAENTLVLGIVSRITPIKQFPLLFKYLQPIISRNKNILIDIVGSGGYRSVQDLQAVLKPLGRRVRWLGAQTNMRKVYASVDYLLTGLPEKEALGLNVIEAASCNLPTLAIFAPPFIETVAENATGYFYTDPRVDNGSSFDMLIKRLFANQSQGSVINPSQATDWLAKFSMEVFIKNLNEILISEI